MFFSAGETKLAIMCHVPKAISEKLSLKDWVEAVATAIDAKIVDMGEEFAKIEAEADQEKGRFPLKLRDSAIAAGLAMLKGKGLIPEAGGELHTVVCFVQIIRASWKRRTCCLACKLTSQCQRVGMSWGPRAQASDASLAKISDDF